MHFACFFRRSAPRPINRSALRGRIAALGKPAGTVGHAAKESGESWILAGSVEIM